MILKLPILLVCAFLFCAGRVAAQETDGIDEAVRREMAKRNVAGASVAVLRNGKIIFSKGYGWANVERRIPVAPATRVQIGSTTKPLTATAVMMLVESGKISLDERAAKYLSKLPAHYGEITVRQLLNHTSGVSRDLRTGNTDDFTIEEFWSRLGAAPVSFKPGERWEYSNTGYILLTLLIESAAGKSYGEVLRERIFQPLRMKDTAYLEPTGTNKKNRAVGYDWSENAHRPSEYFSGGFGAGGLISTASDLAKFDAALDAKKLLRESSLERMFAPAKLANGKTVRFDFRGEPTGYGFGWFLTGYPGRAAITHGGVISGFSSQILRFPEAKISVIVNCNGKSGADRIGYAEYLAKTIAVVFVPDLVPVPVK